MDPTNEIALISGCVSSASTATRSPCTTLKTPCGRPASCSSSAIRMLADGFFSDGLSTNVFPHARATGNIHIGTIAGKLNGVMPTHTPSGCSSECASMPRPTDSECSPLSRCGMPETNSATSMPRCTDPIASSKTLPCSSLITAAISRWWRSINSRNRVSTRARFSAGVARQAGNAAAAACTAASTSAALANGTVRTTSPVAALVTSPLRELRDAVARPLIHNGTAASLGTGWSAETGGVSGIGYLRARER